MAIGIGDQVPDLPLTWMTDSGPGPATRTALFGGRRVALFAVPGAFTPTCSDQHLPSITANADSIRAAGIDLIACLSVNDIFVMNAWGRARHTGDTITLLADGAAAWTRAAGLDWDLGGLGLGIRSQRYAMIVNDTRIEHLAVEQGGAFEVSSGNAVLRALETR